MTYWWWFTLGREEGFPSQYGEQHTPYIFDVWTTEILVCIGILTLGFFAVLPAFGKNKRLSIFARTVFGLLIGGVLLVCNYGHNWELGKVRAIAAYRSNTHEEIEGDIGLHITLRGINITLHGIPKSHHNESPVDLAGERIDYNEQFSWEWAQGILGFGRRAGQISKDFRTASINGVPLPILQIAEYFTFDGEGIRFGRYYRLAGWYTHLVLWCAFGAFLISCILFCMIVGSAAIFLIITGVLQLVAIGIWTVLRNPIEIQIPFQSAENPLKEILLTTNYGPDFYLILVNGILCLLLGILLLFLNFCYPDELCSFFGIDPLTIYDEVFLSKDEIEEANKNLQKENPDLVELGPISKSSDGKTAPMAGSSVHATQDTIPEEEQEGTLVLKRRPTAGSELFQKSFRKPTPKPRGVIDPKYALPQSGKDSIPYYFTKSKVVDESDPRRPLLKSNRSSGDYGSADEESPFTWPPPPRQSQLHKPPTPPPPPKQRFITKTSYH